MLRPRPRCRAIAWPGQPSRCSRQTCRYRASRRSRRSAALVAAVPAAGAGATGRHRRRRRLDAAPARPRAGPGGVRGERWSPAPRPGSATGGSGRRPAPPRARRGGCRRRRRRRGRAPRSRPRGAPAASGRGSPPRGRAAGHRPAPLQVDQHGAVAVALAQRPVVDPEDRRRDLGRRGRRPDQPQQGVARGRHEQVAAQPGAGGPAQREADRRLPRRRGAPSCAPKARRRPAGARRRCGARSAALSQNRRRARSRIATACSPQGRSARVRS